MKALFRGILVGSMVLSTVGMVSALETGNEEVFSVLESRVLSSGQCGENVSYTFDSTTGTLRISGTGDMTSYYGEDGAGGFMVDTLPWGSYREEILHLVIEDGVTSVGDVAFADLRYLQTVDLGNTVKRIGISSFSNCFVLEEITFPDSLEEIDEMSFSSCSKLQKIHFGSGLKVIGGNALTHTGFTTLVLPSSLEVLGERAFFGCGDLASIFVPSSVKEIGEAVFHYVAVVDGAFSSLPFDTVMLYGLVDSAIFDYSVADGLQFTVVTEVPDWDSDVQTPEEGEMPEIGESSPEGDFFFEDGMIKKYLGVGGDVVIPSTIGGEIVRGYEGFEDSTSITSLAFSDTLTTIGSLSGCTNLKAVYVPDDMPLTSLPMGIFDGVADVTVYGSGSAVEDYETVAECLVRWEGVNFVVTGVVTEIPEGYPTFGLEDWSVPRLYEYSTWAEPHVLQARENNLIPESLGRYFGNDILRFQIAESLVQLVEASTGTALEVSGEKFSDTALVSVGKAFGSGIISGMGDGSFGVSETATREQIAVMMVKTITCLEELRGETLISRDTSLPTFDDVDEISEWARDSMGILINNGLMSGVGGGKLSPKSNTTIEQCFVMLNKMMAL